MSPEGRILPGCSVLPAVDDEPARQAKSKKKRDATGRFGVLNTFVDRTLRELDGTAAIVWLILYRDTKDDLACASQSDIATRAGFSPRTVRRALGRLKKLGLLTVVRRGGAGRLPSLYRLAAVPHGRS